MLLTSFLIVLGVGVTVGIIYLNYTTSFSSAGTVENYAGSKIDEDFDIPEHFPKHYSEMLLITHNHIIAFSIIFLLLGYIFLHSSIITGWWKKFFIIEPFISTLVTFMSIWGIRYISPSFSTITMISGILMYASFYFILMILLYELNLKK